MDNCIIGEVSDTRINADEWRSDLVGVIPSNALPSTGRIVIISNISIAEILNSSSEFDLWGTSFQLFRQRDVTVSTCIEPTRVFELGYQTNNESLQVFRSAW